MAEIEDMPEWRSIPGYPRHEVSSDGRVRSLPGKRAAGKILSARIMSTGYAAVTLDRDGQKSNHLVHGLVLLAFVGPRPPGLVTRHLNGISTDNSVSNLTWGTQSENMYDRVRHGTHPNAAKAHCKWGHSFISVDRKSGKRRVCPTCRKEFNRKYEAKQCKGFPHGGAWRRRPVVCLSDGQTYESATAAARAYDLEKRSVIQVCLGYRGRKTTGGMRFAYVGAP